MISSVTPAAKYASSGGPRLSNGKTTIDSLRSFAAAVVSCKPALGAGATAVPPLSFPDRDRITQAASATTSANTATTPKIHVVRELVGEPDVNVALPGSPGCDSALEGADPPDV